MSPRSSGYLSLVLISYSILHQCVLLMSLTRASMMIAPQVLFMSPVRNAPELSNETRVDEEQRWVSRGHAQATLEIRRKLPELRDGDRE